MKLQKLILTIAVSAAGFAGATVSAQDAPITIPASMPGTYEITFASFNADSPFQDGEVSRLVLTSAGDFCLDDEELSDPVMRNGNMAEAIWSFMNDEIEVEFALSNTMTGIFNEVNLSGPGASPFYGQFSATKLSDSQDCTFVGEDGDGGEAEFAELDALDLTITDDEVDVFYAAQELFPQFFGGGTVFKYTSGFIYKYFADSGMYIGLKNGNIYILGGPFGKTPTKQGTVSSLISFFDGVREKRKAANPDQGGAAISGDWDLSLSGTIAVTTSGITVETGIPTITLTDIPAPDPDDLDAVESAIESSLDGVSQVNDVIIEIINNTDTRITFNVEFTATPATGGEASYHVEYDYVR